MVIELKTELKLINKHLYPIPPTVQHLFEKEDVWSNDLAGIYTKSEIDAKLHNVTNHVIDKINKIKEKV